MIDEGAVLLGDEEGVAAAEMLIIRRGEGDDLYPLSEIAGELGDGEVAGVMDGAGNDGGFQVGGTSKSRFNLESSVSL